MLKRIACIMLAGLFLNTAAFASVTEDVKKTVDEVIRIVADKDLRKHDQKRRQLLKKSISSIFDYGEMAKRSMGKHWKDRSPAEKKQFVELFATLLENSYADKIESYNNEKIVYLKESQDGDYADVRSKIVTAKRDEFSLDYRLMKEGNSWKVFDVVIEGVSLVSNYRTQFNKIITANGYSELVKKLQTKTDELKAP